VSLQRGAQLLGAPRDAAASISTQPRSAGGGGTSHSPNAFAPQATTEPSERRAIECSSPAATSTQVVPGGSGGTVH
jgi:hypothetical protein